MTIQTGYHALIRWGGTPAQTARRLGISRQRLHNWRRRGIPIGLVVDLARRTGIPRRRLRPELYL